MNEIKKFIASISAGGHLKVGESERVFQIMMSGGATPAQVASVITGLQMNGETEAEITGGARVLRAKASGFNVPDELQNKILDTCGTGGDSSGSYNISTTVAFIAAACGVPVAKHGNRSVSSRSGSADVLEVLGVDIDAKNEVMEEALSKVGICFMMAPNYHSAMRHVGPVRKELGIRTIFNLLGPLSNPAGAKRQLLGVYDRDLTETMAHVLHNLGSMHALVVHGLDGLDELTTTTKSYVSELKDGKVKNYTIDPQELGLNLATKEQLKGGDAEENAKALRAVLSGETGAYRDIVLLNAAAALLVGGKVDDLKSGIKMAEEAIDSGKAKETLAKLVEVTNR
jgi:anthranilate phosphoribosyltransferase